MEKVKGQGYHKYQSYCFDSLTVVTGKLKFCSVAYVLQSTVLIEINQINLQEDFQVSQPFINSIYFDFGIELAYSCTWTESISLFSIRFF